MAPGDQRRARPRLQVTVSDERGRPLRSTLARWLSGVAPAAARGTVTVAVVPDTRVRALNRAYRGKDYATDVLSFPTVDPAAASAPEPLVPSPCGMPPRRGRNSPSAAATSRAPMPSRIGARSCSGRIDLARDQLGIEAKIAPFFSVSLPASGNVRLVAVPCVRRRPGLRFRRSVA